MATLDVKIGEIYLHKVYGPVIIRGLYLPNESYCELMLGGIRRPLRHELFTARVDLKEEEVRKLIKEQDEALAKTLQESFGLRDELKALSSGLTKKPKHTG